MDFSRTEKKIVRARQMGWPVELTPDETQALLDVARAADDAECDDYYHNACGCLCDIEEALAKLEKL